MRLEDLVIPNGQQESNKISTEVYDSFTFFGDAAFTGGITVEISANDGTTWVDAIIDGVVISIVAGQSVTAIKLHGNQMRLVSDMVEAAERTVRVHASGPEAF